MTGKPPKSRSFWQRWGLFLICWAMAIPVAGIYQLTDLFGARAYSFPAVWLGVWAGPIFSSAEHMPDTQMVYWGFMLNGVLLLVLFAHPFYPNRWTAWVTTIGFVGWYARFSIGFVAWYARF